MDSYNGSSSKDLDQLIQDIQNDDASHKLNVLNEQQSQMNDKIPKLDISSEDHIYKHECVSDYENEDNHDCDINIELIHEVETIQNIDNGIVDNVEHTLEPRENSIHCPEKNMDQNYEK